jgi:hypothetical protein
MAPPRKPLPHMLLLLLATAASAAAAAPAQQPPPQTLLAEFWPSPAVGIGTTRPRLSWFLEGTKRALTSVAYQVVVSKGTSVVWDSGRVAGDASNQVECGVALHPDTQYEWKVRWWSSASPQGDPSAYSAAAVLQTGLFTNDDWAGAVPIDSAPEPPPPPPPPPPPAPSPHPAPPTPHTDPCAVPGACKMVSTTEIKGTAGYFTGQYNESQAHSVSSIPGCIAACEADSACVQITWAPSHPDKCVMYQSITGSYSGGAQGWVKLSGSFVNPADATKACPVAGYPQGCVWFETFADSTLHFVSNCAQFPATCGPAQTSCWPNFHGALPLNPANASFLREAKRGANFSCEMNNFHVAKKPPPAPPHANPAELLRKSFSVSGTVTRATAYVSGVGWVDAFVNGREVASAGDRLNPGRTSFNIRQIYVAYDVTAMVQTGHNAVAILLGKGWQSMPGHTPAARLLLSIETSDGKTSHVITNESWVGSRAGPIRSNDIYQGETYDALALGLNNMQVCRSEVRID